jgi:translin
MGLAEIAKDIGEELDSKEAAREALLKSSRGIVRACGSAIMSIHKGENVARALDGLRAEVRKLNALVASHPDLGGAGALETAHQEYTEAAVLHAISTGASLPGHRKLSVSPQAYLEGMGDVVGELRRMALTAMMRGDIDKAVGLLNEMDGIYDFLMRFDYPSALAGVRRKQDVARSLIEKTRGELAVAVRTRSLEKLLASGGRRARKK